MKIIVTEMPKTPRDCMFSQRRRDAGGYVCQLRPYIYEAEGKPVCLCKTTANCDRLTPNTEGDAIWPN